MKWFGWTDDDERPPAAWDLDDEVDASQYVDLVCGLGGDEILPEDRGFLMPMMGGEGQALLWPVHQTCLALHVLGSNAVWAYRDLTQEPADIESK